MMWINGILALGIGLIFPVYRHMQQVHRLVKNAEATGVWDQIPVHISTQADYLDALQKEAKSLSLKLKIQDSTITVEASDPLPIYNFLHRMTKLPTTQILSFTMKREKGRVVAFVILGNPGYAKGCVVARSEARDRGSSSMIGNRSSIRGFAPVEDDPHFYSPRFSYVNATAEVDGKKQIWVNGKSYGASCPWPLHHTFDKQTGTVKKGDFRPKLSLLALTSKV